MAEAWRNALELPALFISDEWVLSCESNRRPTSDYKAAV
jgi:hypothetical protein